MFDVILVSHGSFARAVLESAELICGDQERVKTYGLYLGESVDVFRDMVSGGIAESLTRGEVLVLSDIQSGSPFNVTCAAMGDMAFHHVTGMNLPMVIEALVDRVDLPIGEVVSNALALGASSMADVNALVNLDSEVEDDDE